MKVHVQFFKPSGKWYTDEEIEWPEDPSHYTRWAPFDSILPAGRLRGMVAVCIRTPWGFPAMRLALRAPMQEPCDTCGK